MNPYADLPASAFWRTAVAEHPRYSLEQLWRPKFHVGRDDVFVTAGSCFAQHLSLALQRAGFDWLDAEPGPERATPALKRAHGYGIYSFRTGSIYTVAVLRQWVEAALGVRPLDAELWQADGRWFDPLRPAIEPGGFASRAEVEAMRGITLAAIRRALAEGSVFVFTLGLTEAWRNRTTGLIYAMCPGTAAGTFDAAAHAFVNFTYDEVVADLTITLDLIAAHNAHLRVLLTVSPVPLTATASGAHVLVATEHSKSILRTAAGAVAALRPDTDYFPSYEVVTSPAARARTFEPNLRSVTAEGVDLVMAHFFAGLDPCLVEAEPQRRAPGRVRQAAADASAPHSDEVACEEALLDAFGPLPAR